jgi:8-oxoguanine deaminase
VWQRLTPDALRAAAQLAFAELLLSGCTTTTDHHYVFPAGLDEAIDVEVEEARRLGIRVVLTRGSMNLWSRTAGCRPRAWSRARTGSSPTASA